ncbi:unnamed protein product [Paramecium octaurelia]|uniref:Uncharacterized protein n=1 Tax=Paramecium octaurelia TaxID=43137 RepID=A0A8S1YGK3_PAROT|nr:unnamed protein product [Paramecium octaurelia]
MYNRSLQLCIIKEQAYKLHYQQQSRKKATSFQLFQPVQTANVQHDEQCQLCYVAKILPPSSQRKLTSLNSIKQDQIRGYIIHKPQLRINTTAEVNAVIRTTQQKLRITSSNQCIYFNKYQQSLEAKPIQRGVENALQYLLHQPLDDLMECSKQLIQSQAITIISLCI